MTGLTERRLSNKRFKTTENAIIMAFFMTKDRLNLERIIRLAHISRSTLYRHHKNIHQVTTDYEEYILRKNKNLISRLTKYHRVNLKILYKRILILMATHKKIMFFLSKFGNANLTEQIVLLLDSEIISQTKIRRSELRMIYIKEVACLIEGWQVAGFHLDEISPTVDKIMLLTTTAYARLTPLAAFDKKPHGSNNDK